MKAQVGIIMGSKSDLPIMQAAADVLIELGLDYDLTIISAHRTPERMFDYAKTAKANCLLPMMTKATKKVKTFG